MNDSKLLIASKNLLAALKATQVYVSIHEGKETWNGDIFSSLLIDSVLAEEKLADALKEFENKGR